jgi:hypothetical protein
MKLLFWFFLVLSIYGCKDGGKVSPKIPSSSPVSKPVDPRETPVEDRSENTPFKLSIKDGKILRDGHPYLLRGFNIADPWHIIKRNHRNDPKAIDFLQDHIYSGMELGGNVVRIPLIPRDPFKEGFLDWTERYLKEILRPTVEFIVKAGWYVILDNHWVKDFDKVERTDLFLWAEIMMENFGNNPQVIFEVFNEPIRPNDWATWVSYIQPMINQMQKVDNLLIVGGPYWSSNMSGANQMPIAGKNITYAGHIYSNQDPMRWKVNYPENCIFTEWGFEVGGTEGGNLEWAKKFYYEFLHKKSWTMWCLSSQWGPRMLNDSGDLTDAGKFYRDII